MSIIVGSAEGPIVKSFISEFDLYTKLGEIDVVEKQKIIGLAGPNDNFQILIEVALVSVANEIGKDLLKLTIEDLYKNNKEQILTSFTKYGLKLIDYCSYIVGIAPFGVQIILGTKSESLDRRRNIGIQINGCDKASIALYTLIITAVMKNIRKYAEKIDSQNKSLNKHTFWSMNDDLSVAIFFDGIVPYIQYRETTDFKSYKEIRVRFTGENKHEIIVLREE